MLAGDEFYGDDITSPTFSPIAAIIARGAPLRAGQYEAPDLIVEAAILRNALEDIHGGIAADYAVEGNLPPNVLKYYLRVGRAAERAERRLQRREHAEMGT